MEQLQDENVSAIVFGQYATRRGWKMYRMYNRRKQGLSE
jgi:hypothetical protein